MKIDTEFPVEIHASALPVLRRMVARDALAEGFIRIGVKGGGCSGFEYILKVDHHSKPIDITIEIEGVLFACDPKSAKFLMGSKIVPSGNLIGGGLKFENPNVEKSCGCGSSFTMKKTETSGI